MALRVSTQSTFMRVLFGIRSNQFKAIRAQEQLSSGRRILRPSDDPSGMARALSVSRQLADVGRHSSAITAGLNSVNTAAGGLQSVANMLTDARSLVIQGLNGTLTQLDRESLAAEFDLLRTQLLEVGNLRAGDRYVFGGTKTSSPPWVVETIGGRERVVYAGNEELQPVRIGNGVDVALNLPGTSAFGKSEPTGTSFAGLSGVASGATADVGSGYEYLTFRHDATDPGTLAAVGIALVDGGARDTLLGASTITVDTANGTVRLGTGPPVGLPDPADPAPADVVVRNELGAELHLDFTGYTGADHSGTVTGSGSVSLDGVEFTPIDFGATDFEIGHGESGAVLHLDLTGVGRAGRELVTFRGATNLFDVLGGIADDLRNGDGLPTPDVLARLEERLVELDRNQGNLLVGLGVLGSRGARLQSASERSAGVEVQLKTLLSGVEDADFAEVALDLARFEQTLQVAQASGARLIQNSLLNFLN